MFRDGINQQGEWKTYPKWVRLLESNTIMVDSKSDKILTVFYLILNYFSPLSKSMKSKKCFHSISFMHTNYIIELYQLEAFKIPLKAHQTKLIPCFNFINPNQDQLDTLFVYEVEDLNMAMNDQ